MYGVLVLFISGCISNPVYKGIVTDCNDNRLSGIKVEAWKNKWMPFHLPEKISEATTNENGEFILTSEINISFFVFSGNKIRLLNHPRKSINECDK